jgi:hypothetical protein
MLSFHGNGCTKWRAIIIHFSTPEAKEKSSMKNTSYPHHKIGFFRALKMDKI